MPITEQVLIEFISDSTGLQPAEDKLAALGKIDKATADTFKKTNTELQKRTQLQNAVAQSSGKVAQGMGVLKHNVLDLDKYMKNFMQNFIEGWQEGIADALKEAGVEFDQATGKFKKGGDEAGKSVDSLKSRVGKLKAEMAILKAQGKDNTDQYKQMTAEAARLSDALGKVSQEVKNVGSDTATLDGLVGIAGGVAGGFAAAQGAMALFGSESEDLQEVLVRVNAAMAITQGITQLQNTLLKEGAAAKLADIIVTKAQTAAQALFTFVVGASTGALKVFRIALATTGVGLLVIALIELVNVLSDTSDELKSVSKDIDYARSRVEAYEEAINGFTEKQLAQAKEAGKLESELIKIRGRGMIAQIDVLTKSNVLLANQRDQLKKTSAAWFALNAAIDENNKSIQKLNADTAIAQLQLQAQLREEGLRDIVAAQEAKLQLTEKNTKEEFELQKRLLDAQVNLDLNAENKTAQEKLSILNKYLRDVRDLERNYARLQLQDAVSAAEGRLATTKKNSREELNAQIAVLRAKAAFDLAQEGILAGQKLAINKKLQKDIAEAELNFKKVQQQNKISGIEAELAEEQKKREEITIRAGAKEIELQASIIKEKANLDLLQEGLAAGQILAIRRNMLLEVARLNSEFNKQTAKEALQDQVSRNNAELNQLNLGNEERQRLQIDNIIALAEIEVNENKGLSDKIKEINAKRDADIKAVRLRYIQETVEYEIQLEAARGGAAARELKRQLDAQDAIRSASTEREKKEIENALNVRRMSLQEQLALIDILANHELNAIGIRIDALNDGFSNELISQREYNVQYEKLVDEQAQIVEDAEQKKRNAAKKTIDEQRSQTQEAVQNVLQVYAVAVNTLSQLYDNQAARENQHLDDQKRKLKELKDAGAITEKEERRRIRLLEAEERQIRTRQAKRDKQIAVFQSLLAIPASFLRGLKDGGLPLAIIYGALAGVQAALVAARPIPKFKKGKKDSYEGLGEVGEAGAELIEKNGRMYIAEKPTIIWLGKKDKVYNPTETRAMRKQQQPYVQKNLMQPIVNNNYSNTPIDYDKLGKSVGKNIPQPIINITEKGMTTLVRTGNSYIEYLENRRRF